MTDLWSAHLFGQNADAKPIAFKAHHIPKIVAGTKTQTRRIERHQDRLFVAEDEAARGTVRERREGQAGDFAARGPYVPGMTLWVREPIRSVTFDYAGDRVYGERRGPQTVERFDPDAFDSDDTRNPLFIEYVSDGRIVDDGDWAWKVPALAARYMPKGLCRLLLEVTACRVEPLQAITIADVLAEGVDTTDDFAHAAWARGWDEINGHRPGGKWEDDPFVSVTEFRVIATRWGLGEGG
jgi:hypothetical protein